MCKAGLEKSRILIRVIRAFTAYKFSSYQVRDVIRLFLETGDFRYLYLLWPSFPQGYRKTRVQAPQADKKYGRVTEKYALELNQIVAAMNLEGSQNVTCKALLVISQTLSFVSLTHIVGTATTGT